MCWAVPGIVHLISYSHRNFIGKETEVQTGIESEWTQVPGLPSAEATLAVSNLAPKPVLITTLLNNLSICGGGGVHIVDAMLAAFVSCYGYIRHHGSVQIQCLP